MKLLSHPLAWAVLLMPCVAEITESAPTTLPASRWIPEQASVALEVFAPGPLIEPLLSAAFQKQAASVPAVQPKLAARGFKEFTTVVGLLEASVQTNWQAIVRTLTRQGLSLAAGGEKRYLLVSSGDDPALLDQVHTFVRKLAASEAEKQGQPDRVRSAEYAGVTGWTFNGHEAHAVVNNRFFGASDAEVLKLALDLDQGSGRSLADRADYQEARKAVGTAAAGMLFVDLLQVRKAAQIAEALDKQNPLMTLLFANLFGSLKNAPWLALGFYVEAQELSIRLFAGGERTQPPKFAQPSGDARGAPVPLQVPRQIAALNLYRDLAGFYAAKDELFPQRTSGLIFFENMMGIFFSGRNLTDEVLAHTTPDIRLVVARQEYDPKIGTPDPQLPAFALVFGMRDPETFKEVLEEAAQKALGLINFTRGQKAQPGLIIDRVDHRGTRFTLARYSDKEAPDRKHLDQRFNFRPALALAKGHAILSSTDQLARDLIDALDKPSSNSAPSSGQAHTSLRIAGTELASILKANRAALVRGNMLKEGKTQAEAEVGMDTLCALVGWVDSAKLEFGGKDCKSIAELRLSFQRASP